MNICGGGRDLELRKEGWDWRSEQNRTKTEARNVVSSFSGIKTNCEEHEYLPDSKVGVKTEQLGKLRKTVGSLKRRLFEALVHCIITVERGPTNKHVRLKKMENRRKVTDEIAGKRL